MPRKPLKPGKGAIGLTYDQALADEICERLAECETLAQICKSPHMPKPGAVYAWARDNEVFNDKFKAAQKLASDKTRVDAAESVESKEIRTGRPTTFTEELVEEFLALVEDGIPYTNVCKMPGMPRVSTIWNWKSAHPEFAAKLSRAMAIGCHVLVGDNFTIADDSSNDYMEKTNRDGTTYEAFNSENVRRSALRIETRKWYLS